MAVNITDNGPSEVTLLTQLHHATRTEHATLNKAIVARLPLCLGAAAPDPYFYAAGMTVYCQIYRALEMSWLQKLEELKKSEGDGRHHEILLSLRTQYLDRSQHLLSDLANLQRRLKPHATASLEELRAQSLPVYTDITNSISDKPHLVLAYAWPMYLALFNGGRWIANQLLNSGENFWQAGSSQTAQEYLSFWYFDDSVHDGQHGENVKQDFKRRFTYASNLLTDTERDEVVQEAKHVFGICKDMIDLLDQHALDLVSAQSVLSSSNDAGSTLHRVVSMLPLQGVWQRLNAMVAYVAAPTSLSRDFEQRS